MNAIRNSDGIFINTQVFREEALHFMKYGYYCAAPQGSTEWIEYWEEQERRCKQGYSVGGVKITGNHYFYLNFNPILLLDDSKFIGGVTKGETRRNKSARKKKDFPNFWDGDYHYYHCRDIARNGISKEELIKLNLHNPPLELDGGLHMIVAKARRKGFSYKNASCCVSNFTFVPDSLSIVGAFDSKYLYPKGTMAMCNSYIDFINANTAWRKKREYVDKVHHKRNSYKEVLEGTPIEKGFMSEIMALTFKDNPDAARGKDALDVLFEEAGKFPNLIDSLKATRPALEDGAYTTGQINIFGTGSSSDDKETDWEDFSEIFYNPKTHNMLSFNNIWDEEDISDTCSYFFPDMQNLVGFIDEQGNSYKEDAFNHELKIRENLLKESKTGTDVLNGRFQEHPNKPSEAFLVTGSNYFDKVKLTAHRNKCIKNDNWKKVARPVILFRKSDGKVNYRNLSPEELNTKLPILDWKPKIKDISGVVMMVEEPNTDAEVGTYKGGYDPYREDQTLTSPSIGSTYIHKASNSFSYMGDIIVAWYNGRPESTDEYHKTQCMLLELYNCSMMHENAVIGVRNWYRRNKKLTYLSKQPDEVIKLIVSNSKVARSYGIHMTRDIKIAGLNYIKKWLEKVVDYRDDGTEILNLNRIFDIALLEELIKYNFQKDITKKANYDRIMALMMVMFQLETDDLNKEYKNKEDVKKSEKIAILAKNQFIKNPSYGTNRRFSR